MSNTGLFQDTSLVSNDFFISTPTPISFTGAFNSGIQVFRIFKSGKIIALYVPVMQAVAAVGAIQTATVALDVAYRPANALSFVIPGVNAATGQAIRFNIATNGIITIATITNGAFTAAANCGNESTVVTYLVN